MKILFAQGTDVRARQTMAALCGRDFRTTTVTSGAEFFHMLSVYAFDAVVLTSGLVDMTSVDVLKQMRRRANQVPVMVLHDQGAPTSDVIGALHAGADEALLQPVSLAEFAARLTALVRRTHGHGSSKIIIGRLTVDLQGRTASVEGKMLKLTRSEYEVLEALVLRKGRVISKSTMFDLLYAGKDEPAMKIIDAFMCKLRKKLINVLDGHLRIETIWGRGYVLQD